MAARGHRLTQPERDLLRLVQRSDDAGDGWRSVSAPLWKAVEAHSRRELLELEPSSGGGGRVRLTGRALIVLEYL